jgi:pimeloyl-ACP methyl ester carboxylesterase
MRAMKNRLASEGHSVADWAFELNTGMSKHAFKTLNAQLLALYDTYKEPITIVGHSLGGSMARAMCYISGDVIEHVITIGSPINNVREGLADFKITNDIRNGYVSSPEEWEEYLAMASFTPETKCTSIWSPDDRVVPWTQSLIKPEDGNNIMVEGKHLKLPRLKHVQDVVSHLLVEDLPCQVYNIRI